MAKWCWDFGFDWNAPVHLVGARYLACGLVDVNETHSDKKSAKTLPPGTPYDLREGDVLCFKFFNLTSGASATDNYTLKALFEFRDADTHELSSLLVKGSRFEIILGLTAVESHWSAIFSAKRDGGNQTFHCFASTDDSQYTVNTGTDKKRFLMSVYLRVLKNGDSDKERIYFLDPEMVVGGMGAYIDANAKRFAS